MNPLEAASEDPAWVQARNRFSKKPEPTLLVEGESDRKLLRRKWQVKHQDVSRNISIQRAKKEKGGSGKEFVLAEFKERRKKELIFALVDMDHDFEGEKIGFSSSVYDTRKFVTLATHYFPNDDAAKEIIRFVISELGGNYKDKLNNKIIESTIRISKVLTWIKLYKGKYPEYQGKFGNFTWGEVDHDRSHDALFRDHIAELELMVADKQKAFEDYFKRNMEYLEDCGINDHMLSLAIFLLLSHWNWAPKRKIGSFQNPQEQAQEILENKYFLKYIEKKSRNEDDEFILKLRDKITEN